MLDFKVVKSPSPRQNPVLGVELELCVQVSFSRIFFLNSAPFALLQSQKRGVIVAFALGFAVGRAVFIVAGHELNFFLVHSKQFRLDSIECLVDFGIEIYPPKSPGNDVSFDHNEQVH